MRATKIDSKPGRWRRPGFMLAAIAALALVAFTWPGRSDKATAQGAAATANSDLLGRYTYADLADKVLPSVVTVYVKRDIKASLSPEDRDKLEKFKQFFSNPQFKQFFGPELGPDFPGGGGGDDDDNNPFISQSSGSGVVISADGYILTDWHVVGDVADKSDVRVVFADSSEVKGNDVKLIFSHPITDLAILKVNKKGLTPIKWGDSDKVRIGERVAAVGSPLDLRATITQGIICAKHRDVEGSGVGDMLQTDAVINPGSSGGALVNLDGELVGINRLITTNSGRWQGYGFAIPSDDAHRFSDEVIKNGKVSYGYIGITMALPTEDTPKMREALGIDKDAKGVLITNVTPGGPADQAGVHVGDFITQADDGEIDSSGELLRNVMRKHVGDAIRLHVLRQNDSGKIEELNLKLHVSERPSQTALEAQMKGETVIPQMSPTPKPASESPLGLTVEPYNQAGVKGLIIKDVEDDSPAARAQLSPGDILVSLNQINLVTVSDLDRAIKKKLPGRANVAQVIHGGRLLLATIDEK